VSEPVVVRFVRRGEEARGSYYWRLRRALRWLARHRKALREIEAHHVGINAAVGRPLARSHTLKIVRSALTPEKRS
jgi:hypothetical protein